MLSQFLSSPLCVSNNLEGLTAGIYTNILAKPAFKSVSSSAFGSASALSRLNAVPLYAVYAD